MALEGVELEMQVYKADELITAKPRTTASKSKYMTICIYRPSSATSYYVRTFRTATVTSLLQ